MIGRLIAPYTATSIFRRRCHRRHWPFIMAVAVGLEVAVGMGVGVASAVAVAVARMVAVARARVVAVEMRW